MKFVPYRRKREGRTPYRKRLTLLTSRRLRLVVRLSEKNVQAQLVDYTPTGDKILLAASSKELEKLGWKGSRSNLPASYLVGVLLGKKAVKEGKKDAILDLGRKPSIGGSRIYAVLKGALDAGLKIPHDEKILPPEERILGTHIEEYAKILKKNSKESYNRQFSQYLKKGVDPTALVAYVKGFKEKTLTK